MYGPAVMGMRVDSGTGTGPDIEMNYFGNDETGGVGTSTYGPREKYVPMAHIAHGTTVQASNEIICKNCGHTNYEGMSYCDKCGEPIDDDDDLYGPNDI